MEVRHGAMEGVAAVHPDLVKQRNVAVTRTVQGVSKSLFCVPTQFKEPARVLKNPPSM